MMNILESQTPIEALSVISTYITEALLPWHMLSMGIQNDSITTLLMRGYTLESYQEIMKFETQTANAEIIKSWHDDSEGFMEVAQLFGKKFPMFTIGKFGTTQCSISYHQTVVLDYADPAFFEQLDKIIELIKTSDDLSQFFSQHPPAVSEDPLVAVYIPYDR